MDTQLTFAVTAFSIHNTASLLVDDGQSGNNPLEQPSLASETDLRAPKAASPDGWNTHLPPGTSSGDVKDYCKRNWMVTVRCIGVGLPSKVAGRYFHSFKASMAA